MYDKLIQLLNLLSIAEYKTAAELAVRQKTGEKTIRTRVKDLNAILVQHGARILARPRYGYLLEIIDAKQYEVYLKSIFSQEAIPVTADERSLCVLAFLINHDDYLKLEDMADFLYVSKNTLTADLKRVEQILSQFHLTLKRRPNYGIRVQGEEFNIRLCMEEYFVRYDRFGLDIAHRREKEMEMIGHLVLEVIQTFQIRLSEIAFQNIANYIYISVKRSQKGRYVTFEQDNILSVINKEDLRIGRILAAKLATMFEVNLPEEEVAYISIHLAGKKFLGGNKTGEVNFVIKEQIDELVLRMLDTIYHSLKLDFHNNLALRMALNQHLVPLDIRLRFGIPCKNPLLKDVKEKYIMAYIVASQAAIVLKEHYGKNISEDEIGYLGLIFALAMESEENPIRKKNVLIVCASGKGSSQLLVYKYKKEFDKYLDHIYDCSLYDLDYFDFGKIDYVFTTVPIKQALPVPIFEINVFLEHRDIEMVREIFELGDLAVLNQYYRPELFLRDVKGSCREEIICNMCRDIEKHKPLPDGFSAAVLQREELSPTDFGNLVAMPHPLRTMTADTFVCVGILEKPVLWATHEVQAVFLVSVSMDADENLQQFYQLTTALICDMELLQELIREKDFYLLMRLLCSPRK